jgi:hypothetical protein
VAVLLLQQVDRQLGLSEAVVHVLDDPRRQASVDHDGLSLLRQRVYTLALGYENLNDHEALRLDLAIQTALGRTDELASSSTLCRWENRADRNSCHHWWPNQFRLLLSSLGYILLEAIRRLALKGTELANAYVGTPKQENRPQAPRISFGQPPQ